MFYLLHHAKGALVLSADDRDQVVEWSRRQLGPLARKASVIESNRHEFEDMVERSGTGLLAEASKGCRPVMNITADLPQGGTSACQKEMVFSNAIMEQQRIAREAIWH